MWEWKLRRGAINDWAKIFDAAQSPLDHDQKPKPEAQLLHTARDGELPHRVQVLHRPESSGTPSTSPNRTQTLPQASISSSYLVTFFYAWFEILSEFDLHGFLFPVFWISEELALPELHVITHALKWVSSFGFNILLCSYGWSIWWQILNTLQLVKVATCEVYDELPVHLAKILNYSYHEIVTCTIFFFIKRL